MRGGELVIDLSNKNMTLHFTFCHLPLHLHLNQGEVWEGGALCSPSEWC